MPSLTAFEFRRHGSHLLRIGFGLDRWLGTTPFFMVVFFVLALDRARP